jgi:hypothetical protein
MRCSLSNNPDDTLAQRPHLKDGFEGFGFPDMNLWIFRFSSMHQANSCINTEFWTRFWNYHTLAEVGASLHEIHTRSKNDRSWGLRGFGRRRITRPICLWKIARPRSAPNRELTLDWERLVRYLGK